MEALIAGGANPNIPNDDGRPMLTWAAQFSTGAAVKLIEARADVNLPDRTGRTAIMAAASGGNADIIKKLVETGADVNSQDKTRIETQL